ncbi:PAS domain-containing protein [Massilia sp. LXY-6]|uniref:PAS domain-containing protein n=1 Tax=Massilia sp. LXY-6 TaxID=3379823 RepID=UPI003EDEB1E1
MDKDVHVLAALLAMQQLDSGVSADGSGQACRIVVEPVDGKLAALESSEERFRRIVHCADEGIWEIDALGFITFVNPKMAALLGCEIEDLLEQPLVRLGVPRSRAPGPVLAAQHRP